MPFWLLLQIAPEQVQADVHNNLQNDLLCSIWIQVPESQAGCVNFPLEYCYSQGRGWAKDKSKMPQNFQVLFFLILYSLDFCKSLTVSQSFDTVCLINCLSFSVSMGGQVLGVSYSAFLLMSACCLFLKKTNSVYDLKGITRCLLKLKWPTQKCFLFKIIHYISVLNLTFLHLKEENLKC